MSGVKPIADEDVMDEFQAMMAELGQEGRGKAAAPQGPEPVSLEQAEQATAVPHVDLSQYQSLGIVDEDAVDVSDKELTDPALLAELKAVAGDEGDADARDGATPEPAGGRQPDSEGKVRDAAGDGARGRGEGEAKGPNPAATEPAPAAAARGPADPSTLGSEATEQDSAPGKGYQRSAAEPAAGRAPAAAGDSPRATAEWEKRQALLAKQRGDKEAALAHMRRYKQLTASSARPSSGRGQRKPQQQQQRPTTQQQSSKQQQQQQQRRSRPKGQAKEAPARTASPRQTQQQAPSRPAQPAAIARHTPATPSSPPSGAAVGGAQSDGAAARTWERLESVLRKQLARAETHGVQSQAATAAREELNRFLAARSTPGQPVPRYRIESRVEQSELVNEDIGPNSLEVTVESATGIPPHAPGKPESKPYVVCNVGFPRDDPTVFKTQTGASGVSAAWNHTHTVTLNRTRSVARQMERRKAVFDIFHERGWFRSDVWIAQAIMPWVGAARP